MRGSGAHRLARVTGRMLFAIAVVGGPSGPRRADAQSAEASQSAAASLSHLAAVMDAYHTRFPVYEDVSSAGNHFHAYAKIPGADAAVSINGSDAQSPRSGATAIRCTFTNTNGSNFGGFYFQNGVLAPGSLAPVPNFGTVPNAGLTVTGAIALTFWARGAAGGERIEFFVGGVGRDPVTGAATAPYPDSSPRRPAAGTIFTLSTAWQPFSIDVTGMDLSYVLGGFGWVASAVQNPSGAVFYLDDIQFELNAAGRAARLAEPRFIRSFATLPVQPDVKDANSDDDIDLVLRNTAFTYDNALALLAFLARGNPDDLARARLIGDAFVYATQHDRFFDDNRACGSPLPVDHVNGARLRTAYLAGDLVLPAGWTPNGRTGTTASPGFYVEADQRFYEVEQSAVDTGNNAWAMLALTTLFTRTGALVYLDTACKLGQFVRSQRNDGGAYPGFLGGIEQPESPAPIQRPYSSSEHNLDLASAFRQLLVLTGHSHWHADAHLASRFVESMWDAGRGCFFTGTTNPNTRNTQPGQLPLDVQAWSVQSLPGLSLSHPGAIACAETHHRTTDGILTGFDFNEDRDGVWFEGTAQMAVTYAMAGLAGQAETVRQTLRLAQTTAPFGDGAALAASSRESLTTGFNFKYFRRLHIGATAWNVFAQLGVNPFAMDAGAPAGPRGFRIVR